MTRLALLRAAGWLVASHNDYLVDATGERRAYWSFSKGNSFVDGDGADDDEALETCWSEAQRIGL